MSGIVELEILLGSMAPQLKDGDYVFCTVAGSYGDYANLSPIATFQEEEGLTLVIRKELAEAGISANVLAGYYHDHIFVQSNKAQLALAALVSFSSGP